MSRSRPQRDKSMQGWCAKSDKRWIGAGIGNDFSQGRRGMARSVRGAKKFVRSRVRQDNKMTIRNQDWELL